MPPTKGAAGEQGIRVQLEGSGALAELCGRLVRIPSPNPPGDTREIAAFVYGYLEDLGLRPRIYAPDRTKPNVVVQIGGAEARPHLVLNGHLDTFPPAEGNQDPYSSWVAEDRIHGCGVSDMKAGLAIMLQLAAGLAPVAPRLRGRVSLTFSSDEETGGNLGTEWLLGNIEAIRRADFCYVLDQSGVDLVGAGEKGAVWLRLRTSSAGGHAAYRESASAIDGITKVLSAIVNLRSVDIAGGARGLEESPAARAVTVNIGRIEGGSSPNLIATSAAADVDVRIPVGGKTIWVLDEVSAAIARCEVNCAVDVLMLSEPTTVDTSLPFVGLLCRQIESALGRAVRPAVRIGASDARLFRRAGVPALVYGPAAHHLGTPREHVEISELNTIAGIYARTLSEALLA